MLKVSVIVPVKNEASSIAVLLDALLSQSRLPDEIVITDGGSTDNTVQIINSYAKKNDFIRLICLPHAFAGKGRNTSIAHSKNNIIASIDAGCVPAQNWLEELIEPFEENTAVEVVYGLCKPAPKTLLETCFVLSTEPDGFSTSVASMAHKKEVWEKTGGYPEDLGSSEDTIFKSKICDMGFKTAVNDKARVYWQARSRISDFFKQFYDQSKSSGYLSLRAWFHIRKIIFIITVIFFAVIGMTKYRNLLFFALLLYIIWIGFTVTKHYGWFKGIKCEMGTYFILPIVFIVRDAAQISGFISGIIRKMRNRSLYGS
ncbi:MAG: glycosyltransferase [Candidatus Omnitrophica bacterium]|nr:glycosyltransferase [Candidatus Omnitrophota bacterium]